jgi:hypothetical protein
MPANTANDPRTAIRERKVRAASESRCANAPSMTSLSGCICTHRPNSAMATESKMEMIVIYARDFTSSGRRMERVVGIKPITLSIPLLWIVSENAIYRQQRVGNHFHCSRSAKRGLLRNPGQARAPAPTLSGTIRGPHCRSEKNSADVDHHSIAIQTGSSSLVASRSSVVARMTPVWSVKKLRVPVRPNSSGRAMMVYSPWLTSMSW